MLAMADNCNCADNCTMVTVHTDCGVTGSTLFVAFTAAPLGQCWDENWGNSCSSSEPVDSHTAARISGGSQEETV